MVQQLVYVGYVFCFGYGWCFGGGIQDQCMFGCVYLWVFVGVGVVDDQLGQQLYKVDCVDQDEGVVLVQLQEQYGNQWC